jgi:hypothetical protein
MGLGKGKMELVPHGGMTMQSGAYRHNPYCLEHRGQQGRMLQAPWRAIHNDPSSWTPHPAGEPGVGSAGGIYPHDLHRGRLIVVSDGVKITR